MSSWTWRDIVQLWLGALAASLLLLAIQFAIFYHGVVTKKTKFFWLLPYPGTLGGVVALTRLLARGRPLIAAALYGVPGVALALTVYWMLSR